MRPDPGQSGVHHVLGETRILREEAVAGMNRGGTAALRGIENRLTVQVARRSFGRTDEDRAVRPAHVQRVAIGFGKDGDRFDAEATATLDHSNRDLSAVRDKDTSQHRYIRKTRKFGSLGAWRAARAKHRPITSRVCAGSISPSSQIREVAK